MKILNCTPHDITIVKDNGVTEIIPVSGIIPRLEQEDIVVGEVEGIPITKVAYGENKDLPEKEEDTFLIVSALVANANKDRDDLLIPGGLVRDEQGKIVGCKSLARVN